MSLAWLTRAAMIAASVLLTGTAIAPSQAAPNASGAAPIGSGWTEIFPKTQLDQPPGLVRHTVTNGVHHMWVLSTDPSKYPGRDSGPRSELRFFNDYTSGQAQFQADIEVKSGCSRASIMQVFGASGRATAFMAWAMPNDLSYYDQKEIYAPLYDHYLTLNVLHDTSTGKITVYVNGALHGTFQDHGDANHYFKVGVYHQKNMSARCDEYVKNIHIYKK